jgi:hypothetical protein
LCHYYGSKLSPVAINFVYFFFTLRYIPAAYVAGLFLFFSSPAMQLSFKGAAKEQRSVNMCMSRF